VDDLVEALVRMIDQDQDIGPVNLGNPNEFTIAQLAELVIELTGSRSELVRGPLPKDDPTRRQPDITRARALLGWEPTVELKEGLQRTIGYFKELLESGEIDRVTMGG
jgi:UDP-glucuronate decarboxylase